MATDREKYKTAMQSEVDGLCDIVSHLSNNSSSQIGPFTNGRLDTMCIALGSSMK